MNRSLRPVSRALLVMSLVTLVVTLCPCLPASDMAMDDCCPPGLTVSTSCCDREATPALAVSTVSALASTSAPAALPAAVAMDPITFTVFRSQQVVSRPVVARTILRI